MAPATKRGFSGVEYLSQAFLASSTALALMRITSFSRPYSPKTKFAPPNVLVSIISAPASR